MQDLWGLYSKHNSSLTAVVVGSMILMVLTNHLSVAGNKSVNTHCILHPLLFFLPCHAYGGPLNDDRPCPHPSLEGRGDMWAVGNDVLAVLECERGKILK